MKDQNLQQQVFDYIKDAAEKIGDFAAQEVPPFITEFLQWKFLEAAIEAIFRCVPVLIGVIWFVFYCKKLFVWALVRDSKNYSDSFWTGLPILLSIISAALIFACFPYSQIKDMTQIKVAPKVYLLEQGMKLIK